MKPFALAWIMLIAQASFAASDFEPLIKAFESKTKITLTRTVQRIRGSNCVIDAQLLGYPGVRIPQIWVIVFDPVKFSTSTRTFDPDNQSYCRTSGNLSGVTTDCSGQICETQGCVIEATDANVTDTYVRVKDLTCVYRLQ